MLRMLCLLPVLALLAAPAAAQQAEPPEPVLVSMGTAAVTGVYFPVGVSLCRLVNQHRRETGLRDGRLELAIVQSDVQAPV